MSVRTLDATVPPAATTAVRPATATLAVARAEARLLLRSATLWVSVLLATALGVVSSWPRMQSWETFAQNSGSASLVLAGGLLLAGHLAAGRDHRYAMTETTGTLPAPAHRRIAALLVYVPVAIAAGALAVGVQLLFLLPYPPAGPLSVSQVLAGVVTPPLGALIGIAVGRWAPAAPVGPLALVAGAVLVLTLPTVGYGDSNLGWWMSPMVTGLTALPGAPQPHGLHLAYLLALMTAVAAAALTRRRRWMWAVVAAVSLTAAGGAVVGQTRQNVSVITEAMTDRYTEPAALQCQSHDGVRYCALPGYGSWVPLWRDAVAPVVAALPANARERLPMVRQVWQSAGWNPDKAAAARHVLTWQSWGRHGSWAQGSRAELAIAYSRMAVDLPAEDLVFPTPGGPVEDFRCAGDAQPRTVVALWLAAQSLPDGAQRLAAHRISLTPVDYGRPEIDAAMTLLRRPRAEVIATVTRNWQTITSGTVGGDALRPLGVTFPNARQPASSGTGAAVQNGPCP